MSEPTRVTLTGLDVRPTGSGREAQSEELMERVMIPLADLLRSQKSPDGRAWHPEAIYLAFFRAGAMVLGTEWILESKELMGKAWDSMVPVLKSEADDWFDSAMAAFTEQANKGPKH